MRSTGTSAVGIALLAILAGAWFFFAPPQLGGSTQYASTVGISMVPMFRKGDLAVVRPALSYRVGDVVLYQSEVLKRPVLHRIIVIQDGHYFFKGDNNDFVDPGYALRGDLQGKLWIKVPHAGKILSWFGAPSHSAFLAAGAALVLMLGGSRRPTRVRRRRAARLRTNG
jgi:signal peptidase I